MKIELIHIPKCAGISLGKIIYDHYPIAQHRTLKTKISECDNLSETLFLAVIRNPIDRFISSYKYHTNSSYNGIYTKKIQNLKKLSLESYFLKMSNEIALKPQVEYVQFNYFDKKVNLKLLRFDSLIEDLTLALNSIEDEFFRNHWTNRLSQLQHLNKSSIQKPMHLNNKLKNTLENFYKEDLKLLGKLNV